VTFSPLRSANLSQIVTSSDVQSGAVDGSATLIPAERIESRIFLVRGQKVLLDRDLAELYGTTTRLVNQAVRRNGERFPADFMFALTRQEIARISQIETSSGLKYSKSVFAFTEQGVAMLSGLLNSPRAIAVNIGIMRTFVRLRQLIASNADLSLKLTELESKYDEQFKVVFDAIRELMSPIVPRRTREMGFHTALPELCPVRKRSRKTAQAA
jgi:hypothetical protein